MKRIFAYSLFVLGIGCTHVPRTVDQVPGYRDRAEQIASQTDVTAQRMAGTWFIRERFPAKLDPAPDYEFVALPNGGLNLVSTMDLCMHGICAEPVVEVVTFAPTGPGRWEAVSDQTLGLRSEIWIMWMDFDSRTAAIGTPSGEFGWIMDKSPTGGADRIVAAREIMDWFGYDVSRLEDVYR